MSSIWISVSTTQQIIAKQTVDITTAENDGIRRQRFQDTVIKALPKVPK